MSSEHRLIVVVPPVPVATQKIPQVQTGEIFKLPVELFFEILSYFNDHRRYVRDSNGAHYTALMRTEHVERSTVIRKLTMTCWALRDTLLPVLWKEAEGCVVRPPPDCGHTRETYGLYAQCVYLLANPTIAAYVRVLSVDLSFKRAPEDLMTKFVDTLVRLPNLRTLELLDITHADPVTRELKRECAQFPSIREITVCPMYPDFVRSCPNLESLTLRRHFVQCSRETIGLCGARLRRVGGVGIRRNSNVESVVRGCPQLQEIALYGFLSYKSDEIVKLLRQAEHLSVVETHFIEHRDKYSGKLERRKAWKAGLVDVLKNSPSEDHKFLRWKVSQIHPRATDRFAVHEVVEIEELEVLP